MKWEKLGKIFDPTQHKLPNECYDYAQSPQALVFDDYVRIYFSTRKKDQKNSKFLSHIAFVDMSKDFTNVLNVSNYPVIELGHRGCFDEHGIFPMNVVRYKEKIYAYTCGLSRKSSVVIDTSIGFAESNDNGTTFQKLGDGPILSTSLHEPFLIGDPFVKVYNDVFHMWYLFGTEWKRFSAESPPDRVYKIGHAISQDGINWKKEGRQILEDKFSNESQALPTVIAFNNKYHMFFCYRQSFDFRKNKDRGYRIGYAYSDDLERWHRDDASVGLDVSENGWDSDMLCYPHVFECNEQTYLLYNGNEFGKYGFGIARLIEG